MKIFREEKFGGILYDTETLRYSLVTKKDTKADTFLPMTSKFVRDDILSSPVRIYFEITRKCNLYCKHCFVNAGKSQIDGLSHDNMLSLIDQFADARVLELRITGGEPTQREGWSVLLKHARSRGMSVSLNTNGVYDNLEDTVSKMIDIGLNQITVSIDGIDKTHDSIRGRGSYNKMLKAVEYMHSKDLPLRFNTVINKRNYLEIPQIVQLADGLVSEINFFYMRPVGRAIDLNDEMLSFEEHYQSAMDTIALRPKHPNLRIMHFEQSFTERSILEKKDPVDLRKTFPYGSTTIGVTCLGEYAPHGYSPYQDKSLTLGKYPDDSLTKIWHESQQLDEMRVWFSKLLKQCNACDEYNMRCAGLNFEMKVAENVGDISKNPYCISNISFANIGGK